MPWGEATVSELRLAFVQQIEVLKRPLAEVAREFGVSRKTAYKWLARYRAAERSPEAPPLPQALADRSRRPRAAPQNQTPPDLERQLLRVHQQFGWGAKKVRALLRQQQPELVPPSVRTCHAILKRHGCTAARQAAAPQPAPQFFQRAKPHELWQCDFKGGLEVARKKVYPFTVLDDCSRYLLGLVPCQDVAMRSAWEALWSVFGEFGLPEAILSDNAFGSAYAKTRTLSWFESRLVRLRIEPLHGRPHHPQTQGKVERLHGTLERELWPHVRRDCLENFQADLQRWRTEVYNVLRPHEALGDAPPASRFGPSPRPRPQSLPEPEYPPGAILRKVSPGGDVQWRNYRILAGAGLAGQHVRVEPRERELVLFYSWKQIRSLATAELVRGKLL